MGMPMCLSFDLFPFWHTLFTKLGFRVRRNAFLPCHLSEGRPPSVRHGVLPCEAGAGHVKELAEMPDVDYFFYPCMSYNFNEGLGDNHYNCPVVALLPGGAGRELPRA